MTDIVIAVAGAHHSGEVLTVQRAAYVTEAQRYGDPFRPPLTQSLGELGEDVRAGRRLIALRVSRVVGAIRGEERDGLLHVGRLAVAPDQQGAGIGTGLLLAVEGLAGPAVTAFALFTGADSEANLRLYQGLGYRRVRHEPLPHGPGLTHLEKPRRSPGSGVPD